MSLTNWSQFWENQKESFNAIMVINTYFFGVRMEKVFNLKSADTVLDYGCGPGLLADYLAPKGNSYKGTDINLSFIEECKQKHPASSFIHITTNLAENEIRLGKAFQKNEFDFIILLSITQYFKDEAELDQLVAILKPYLKQNGKIIVADVIDEHTSSLRDVFSLFIHSLRNGKSITFIKFVFYLLFSDYRKISKQIPLLTLTETAMGRIADKHLFNCERVKDLTIHPSRTNYILTNI